LKTSAGLRGTTLKGTTPPGAADEEQASRWVREMFGRVAHGYDLANHTLSLNLDRAWRRKTVERVREVLARPDAVVLDLCCGTGDLTLALSRERGHPVFGSDYSRPMLNGAANKHAGLLFESDALQLPLADRSADLITCAFGFRNLVDYDAGLRELRRVIRPGGMAAILEFSHPPGRVFPAFYRFYSLRVLPLVGGWISGDPSAYSYLQTSVEKFPGAEELASRMESAGFRDVAFERMTGGVVALHTARV
jgi:demethylmenaquinone methyltransferase/2-methoxy-6-polyprenyl-1,4-benzoquinol methylase